MEQDRRDEHDRIVRGLLAVIASTLVLKVENKAETKILWKSLDELANAHMKLSELKKES